MCKIISRSENFFPAFFHVLSLRMKMHVIVKNCRLGSAVNVFVFSKKKLFEMRFFFVSKRFKLKYVHLHLSCERKHGARFNTLNALFKNSIQRKKNSERCKLTHEHKHDFMCQTNKSQMSFTPTRFAHRAKENTGIFYFSKNNLCNYCSVKNHQRQRAVLFRYILFVFHRPSCASWLYYTHTYRAVLSLFWFL